MTLQGSIMSIVPGLQATAILGPNLRFVKKSFESKKINPMLPVKAAVANFAGIGLMKPTASMINTL